MSALRQTPTPAGPIIGDWYEDLDSHLKFEVVALDPTTETIEIQYANGDISELDDDCWTQLPLITTVPPESPTSIFEDTAGFWSTDDSPSFAALSDPLTMIEPDLFPGTEDF